MRTNNQPINANRQSTRIIEKAIGLLIICITGLVSITASAQNKQSATDNKQIIFKGNHISIEYARLLNTKARISPQTGTYPMSSQAVWSGKLGLLYHINFNTELSFTTGVEAAVAATNFITTLHKNDFSPSLDRDYSFTKSQNLAGNLILSVPVMIEKKFWCGKSNFISAEAGIGINYSTQAGAIGLGYGAKNSNDSIVIPINFNLDMNNNGKPWLSYLVNVAYSWHLRNNNYLQLGIGTNLSFTKYISGNYIINVPGKPLTTGAYSSTGTYNQIFLRYIFTGTNHRLRKQKHS